MSPPAVTYSATLAFGRDLPRFLKHDRATNTFSIAASGVKGVEKGTSFEVYVRGEVKSDGQTLQSRFRWRLIVDELPLSPLNLTVQEVRLPDLRLLVKVNTEISVESEDFRRLKDTESRKFVLVLRGNESSRIVR
jgi:hypothetical protein